MTLRIFNQSDENLPRIRRGVALGFFDGVHRGHADLIRTLIMNCSRLNLEPVVFTFDEHPATITHRNKRFGGYISTWPERLRLFEMLGVSEVHRYHFDDNFSHLSPISFLDQIISEHLESGLIVVGEDYRFGYRGEGTVDTLRTWCAAKEVELIVVTDVELYGQRVSSTRIRKLIEKGDMQMASSCLGRPFSLSGQVIKGRKLGRKLGFPTANFIVSEEQISPVYGVYVTRTKIGERTWRSITSYGLRPTVNSGDATPIVETYLYDTNQDLYGQEIEVLFLEMLREEKKFDSLLQLGTQIRDDFIQAHSWHQKAEDSYISNTVNNIPIWLLQSDRFAQGNLQLVFQQRLERKNSAAFALLLEILTAGCRRFPGRIQLSTELDRLYGSSIDSYVQKNGDMQTLYISVDGLISWSDGSQPFAEAIQLLFDMLFDPMVDDDGCFDQSVFESERQSMITELKARENDRARFAYDRSIELLCGDQPHGLRAEGSIEDLAALTMEDVKAAYRKLLYELPAMACIGGRISKDLLSVVYDNLKRFPEDQRAMVFGNLRPAPVQTPKEVIETDEYRKLEQARVNLILTGLPPYFSHRSIVSAMLNSMLGGDVHSLLFDVVREKMGLAYSVFSANSRYLSAILIIAGIEPTKTEEAIEAMKQQIADLSAARFDDRLMETSRSMLASSIEGSHDDLGTMVHAVINSVLLGRRLSRQDMLSLLETVRREEISQLASELKLAVCYRLLPEDSQEGER